MSASLAALSVLADRFLLSGSALMPLAAVSTLLSSVVAAWGTILLPGGGRLLTIAAASSASLLAIAAHLITLPAFVIVFGILCEEL